MVCAPPSHWQILGKRLRLNSQDLVCRSRKHFHGAVHSSKHQPSWLDYSLILVGNISVYLLISNVLLDSDITLSCATVMGALEDLLVQEKTLVSQIQAMEDTLSGVRVHIAELRSVNKGAGTYNLPSETLSAIFEAGLTETPETRERNLVPWDDQSEQRTIRFELLVSSVSRRWRNVALQTPRLWTVLDIDVLRLTHDLDDLYLHRSKMCLLDITLGRSYRKSVQPDCVKRHLDQLVPHVGRWRKFIVRNGSFRLSALSHLCAPALETLVLNFTTDKPEIELFSRGAPCLHSLELIGAKF
jgi:hypothetical protein